MNIKTKIITTISMFAFLAAIVAPVGVSAATNIKIKDNGWRSKNKVKVVKVKKSRRVRQHNGTAVVNLTGVFQNTGFNKANRNTTRGGRVKVKSGNTKSTVSSRTIINGNSATVGLCGCERDEEINVTIKDNGAKSNNKIKVVSVGGGTNIQQGNETLVVNGVLVAQNTGGNSANSNTGGAVALESGNTTSTVTHVTKLGGNYYNTQFVN